MSATELFDVCDEAGRPLGVTKSRDLVHKDGDWHRTVHIWVALLGEGGPFLVLQRRSLTKDSHPGAVDVSVAGHLRAGETFDAGVREAEEELGLRISAAALVRLGTRKNVDRRSHHGEAFVDRELQEVFCTVSALDFFATLRPDPEEVAAVLSVTLEDAQALFDGDMTEIPAKEIRASGVVETTVLRRKELVQGADDYFAVAARAIGAFLDGADDPLPLGFALV
jgi:isopentenyldiphosphate isomerase